MGVELRAEGDWDSLGEASKRWRVKRRRVDADVDPGPGLQYRNLTRVRALPLPPRGATTHITAATTEVGGSAFDRTRHCCELTKCRHSEAQAKGTSESYTGKENAGASPAANSPTRKSRRRHRLFLANEALFGKLQGSIPKLALLPQTVSWSLSRECGSGSAADCRHYQHISSSVEHRVAYDTLPTNAGGPVTAQPQSYNAAQRNCTSINVKGGCENSTGAGNPAIIGSTIHNDDHGRHNSDNSFSDNRDASSSSSSPPTSGNRAAADVGCHANNHNGSSWELLHHFPPDALVPRASLSRIFPFAPVSATTTAAHQPPTHIPLKSSMASGTVPATNPSTPLPATPTARPKIAESTFPTTPTGRRPHASNRARAWPRTVSAGLHELGLAWGGGKKGTTSETMVVGGSPAAVRISESFQSPAREKVIAEGTTATTKQGGGGNLGSIIKTPRGAPANWGAPRGMLDGTGAVGLTAEVIKSPGVALDRSGRVAVVEKHMLAFDEVWPADLPVLRPLRLNLRRSCGAVSSHRHAKGTGIGGGADGEAKGHNGPVLLMPMHREGKGVEGREDELFAEPPRLKRVDQETAMNRDRYCFRDESRYGESLAVRGKGRHSGQGYGDGERKWARCKLWETGVETWRWEWSPEARVMLGRLALWKGALLVSRTQAFVTVFGLGMAGRVVVEGAPHPRGLQIEAYVPASSETCQLHVSIDDLKNLFWDDPQKMWVGKKGDMVVELVKMLYFEYKLETEVADSSVPDGIRLKAHHYSDREPWACLQDYRDSDYDLHWESRRSTTERWGGEGPTGAPAIKTQIVQAESLSKGSEEPGVEKIARRGHVPDVASFDVSDTGSSIATSHSVAAIPDERAVWISQRLRIRSIQNLVDVDLEVDATPQVSGKSGGYGAAASEENIPETERNESETCERDRIGNDRDAPLSPTTAARHGPRKGRHDHSSLSTRKGTKTLPGTRRTKSKVRMKAFDIRVEEYKEERRHAEKEKEAKLKAWMAIKKRFRGLTLGTAVRISGRLLHLMVYEFPDQPGTLRVSFTDAGSGETFRVSLGVGPVAALARHISIASSPENWTLGQRRRLIKGAIRQRSALVRVEEEEEEADGDSHRGRARKKTRRHAFGQSVYCVVRCLGRASTPSYFPAARTAARGFVRRRNAHQLQQPSPRDHRRRFPALIPSAARTERGMTGDRSELRPQTNEFRESPLTQAPLTEEVVHDGASTVDGDGGHDGLSADHLSAATRPVTDLEVQSDATDAFGAPGRLRPLRPRRECGRGRRLCGGVARIRGIPGFFSLLRGNWVGAEEEFVLDWYHPWGFRPSGFGPVEPHTTFSLHLLTQDLYLFTEGLDLMTIADTWKPGRPETPVGVVSPSRGSEIDPTAHATTSAIEQSAGATTPAKTSVTTTLPEHQLQQDRLEGSETPAGMPPATFTPAERIGKTQAFAGGIEKQVSAETRTPSMTECEAWERVAREVLRRCFWKRTWSTASGNGRHQRPSRGRTAGLETNLPSLEEYVISQTYRTNPSGTEPTIEEPPHGETDARTATAVVQLAIRTRIFRRVIKVAGLGIPPKFLLVVVCQWHDALVVRCYDFLSGVIREAERPDPDRDAALLLEFKSMSRLERDMQLQVMLDELVVFEDTAHASEDSESTWSVRFAEDAGAPIIIDAGSDMYDQQVEEQMAAAAALVDKRREDMQRVQHAAREKDRRARERKNKRDEKRREAQAKSRKKGGKRANEAKRRGRTTRGGERRGAASEDSSDQSQESGDG